METRTAAVNSIIEQVIEVVRQRIPSDNQSGIESFVRDYYAGLPFEDLTDKLAEDLYGAALAHWNFALQRSPGVAKVRVYNPLPEQHGWQSTHTVVDVVLDDKPFLVDSLRMAVDNMAIRTHLMIHPMLQISRNSLGSIEGKVDAKTESWIHIEVDRQAERDVLEAMQSTLCSVLEDVAVAVEDWPLMRARLQELLIELEQAQTPPPVPESELKEGRAFLEWMDDNHFTFLGYRDYTLLVEAGHDVLRAVPDSGLGILRNPGANLPSPAFQALSTEGRSLARKKELMIITKGNTRSTIHRPGYLDYVGVKRFDDEGNVIGECRFLGLYTSAAYNRSVQLIPMLRDKVARVSARSGFAEGSHPDKELMHIMETLPRDEILHLNEDQLFETAMGITYLQERQRIRIFVNRERYGRFYSCLVYIPRDRFNSRVRNTTQCILEEAFQAKRTEYSVQLSDSMLARVYFVLRVAKGGKPEYNVNEIQAKIEESTRLWTDDLEEALLDHCGEELGSQLTHRYGDAFSAAYRENYSARVAVRDIEKMEALARGDCDLAMTMYRPLEASSTRVKFKLFHPKSPVSLSEAIEVLENMGLRVDDERPSQVNCVDGTTIWVHDFGMTHGEGSDFDVDQVQGLFHEAFARIWHKEVEDDEFNRLVLGARMSWREIVILRAYCKYLRQIGVTYSQDYMQETLTENPHVARMLAGLFQARFNPEAHDEKTAKNITAEIELALDSVAVLDQDRILRAFLGVIQASLRTNYYQSDENGDPKPYLSLKFDPHKIPDLPEPRPQYEIFVYSPRVEGVHLRGGAVARGGLRWSDRREDFRTEVLGLMKAQMVKNAVIVPVGSKGGFIPKNLMCFSDRESRMAEGIECYRIFICGLLDITDNLRAGEVMPPDRVIRYDGDDPYLVVAADKGTATFSDIANEIACRRGFWLGDAFASGGSAGYDHKVMGITARGAWESVKRHFREMGLNTQSQPFTVVGIGDMSGDVFGNGMLLSKHIHLIAAFNHLHVFLDPNPDPESGYRERKRLFDLPRSSWDDYDPSLISAGGGVYPRVAKSIPLSSEVQQVLGVKEDTMTPSRVIRAILKAPVDLLWNGGIGTYVKASEEIDSDAGDRTNDAVRVNANELCCRVVGEGGNLGLTQRGRIEFGKAGGRVLTDSIDNSAGVDCSDHEVNIKILLNDIVNSGDLTQKQRNTLLAEMTDNVGELVVKDNYLQTQALSLAATQTTSMLDVQSRLIRVLASEGALKPELEFLPDKVEIEERKAAGRGLESPELAVLMGYVKMTLYEHLLESDLPDRSFFVAELARYFPQLVQERYAKLIPSHRLAREIVCTMIANEVVNRAGSTFVFRLAEETGAHAANIAGAYVTAREVFDHSDLWSQIEALDNKVSSDIQCEMLLAGRKLIERSSRWIVRNRPHPINVHDAVSYFKKGIVTLTESLVGKIDPASRKAVKLRAADYHQKGVPKNVAERVACFPELIAGLDIVEVANNTGAAVEDVIAVYFALGAELQLHWMRDQINGLPRDNRWQALARSALRDDLYNQQRLLTADILLTVPYDESSAKRISSWLDSNNFAARRCREILTDLRHAPQVDFTMLSVAMREIRGLHQIEMPGTPVLSSQPKQAGPAAA